MPIEFFSELRATLAKVEAHTARRHQVRAHAAHLGHPLIGDSLYGSKRNLEPLANGALPAFILHAETLSFFHPELRKQIVVEAPRPAYLIEVLKKYQALQGSNI
jgi:23S rRNA pseudouridine1911/1915/1917 synthase